MKNTIELRKRFGEKLKNCCRERHIRQLQLAEALGISRSAISQVVHGKIMLTMEQLDKICEVLALSATESYEFHIMLNSIRSGAVNYKTPFNRQFFALRVERGVSICKLAKLTGIAAAKLRSFEEDLDPLFTPDDAVRLAGVFNVDPELLLSCANLHYNGDFTELKKAAELPAVADGGKKFKFDLTIPVAAKDVLLSWDPQDDLWEHVAHNGDSTLACTVQDDDKMIAITSPATDLGLNLPGKLTLVLSASGKESTLQLGKIGRGLVLYEKRGRRRARMLQGGGLGKEPQWSLPVVEMSLMPEEAGKL